MLPFHPSLINDKAGAMHVEPDFESFSRLYKQGKPQLVWTRLVADLETPVSAMLKLAHDRPMSFLLESVEGGAARGRYSILGFAPDLVWRAFGDKCEINTHPAAKPDDFKPCPGGTLKGLRTILNDSRLEVPEALPPMSAGVFIWHDTVRLVERLPTEKPDHRHPRRRSSARPSSLCSTR
jgi:anthranilate synthase component 1